jgi:hypothetical protein
MLAYGVEKDLMIAYRYFLPTYAVSALLAAYAFKAAISSISASGT